jgi:hypothetical protein
VATGYGACVGCGPMATKTWPCHPVKMTSMILYGFPDRAIRAKNRKKTEIFLVYMASTVTSENRKILP